MRLTSILFRAIVLDSKVSEILTIINFTSKQWDIFKKVTDYTAKSRYFDPPTEIPRTWIKIEAPEREAITSEVRQSLKENGITRLPEPEDLLRWRMNRVLKNMRRTRKAIEAREKYILEHKATRLDSDVHISAHMNTIYRFIRVHINAYAQEHPNHTWTEIPEQTRHAIFIGVNKQLLEAGIPPVKRDLMEHRMEMALMYWKVRNNREVEFETEGVQKDTDAKKRGRMKNTTEDSDDDAVHKKTGERQRERKKKIVKGVEMV
ncbi:hypothetical protein P280DRAFT_271528 [Massarina eburnea CBS 473.64]|uniref:Uncharacterized protein n=1 Tax=Massarina eburnea CBS 473.64 TaxID=1395130 RepID=A0A6A6S662_9PLEO|nr:hypothetical protein P280DRAFT_271528 [Massarina eburnea CBS 473.64]